jgi:RNA-directed DNA polymerase
MSYPDYAQRAHSLSDCSCPLAVAAMKDKIVQRSTVVVLNVISTRKTFLGFSYGFRPKRSQHDALDALVVGITRTKVNYIVTPR